MRTNPPVAAVSVAVLAVFVVVLLGLHFHDPKLSGDATAAALERKLHTPYGFRCAPAENDGSIALDDVDFLCEPSRAIESRYGVGTDGEKITEILPTG
ncbi:MAG TPA: hypothetical protein VGU26_07135 [Gaiellaceae bacterium]|nr:hypothetical protein [Gaiellaceae bacterium]